jgi:hypothetical protein
LFAGELAVTALKESENVLLAEQVVDFVSCPDRLTVAPDSQVPANVRAAPFDVNGLTAGFVMAGALGATESRIQLTVAALDELLPQVALILRL